VSLNTLASRNSRREQPVGVHIPDPIIARLDREDGTDPEDEALLSDTVGLALMVVLETLNPAERLSFVLHDMFGAPFDEIAPILDRSSDATRQLASRARRRVQDEDPHPDADLAAQHEVVEAYLSAARDADFDALVAVLDPDAVLRADAGPLAPATREVRGAEAIASRALGYARLGLEHRLVLVNGALGVITSRDGEPFSIGAWCIRDGRIVEIDFLSDPDRLRRLELTRFGD
jgi:RNA polymerase sigma-70 factor, ECF subfamily